MKALTVGCKACGFEGAPEIETDEGNEFTTSCPKCGEPFDRRALLQIALSPEPWVYEYAPSANFRVGDVVVTDQRVVREVRSIDESWWVDEHGEDWHVLQVVRVRTSHAAGAQAHLEFGEAA